MSASFFNHQEYILEVFADRINKLIYQPEIKPEWEDEFVLNYNFSPEVISKLKDAVNALRVAQTYVNRIDFMLREVDSRRDFLRKLNSELNALKNTE